MEYTLERFELDMRKVDLYVENAVAAFNITADEASLYSESTEYDLIMTEASDGLGAKIKAAFSKIIQAIKKFFSGIIEKVKSVFTKGDETKVKQIIASSPEVGKQKIEVDDIKAIENFCGKRKVLCAKLVKKAKAGTLTQDEFDKTVQQMDALEEKVKSVGKIAIPVTAALALVGTAVAVISHFKKHGTETLTDTKELDDSEPTSLKVKVAEKVAETNTKAAQARLRFKVVTWEKIKTTTFRRVVNNVKNRKVLDSKNDQVLNAKRDTYGGSIGISPDATDHDKISALHGESTDDFSDFDDFDLTDTFFDI